MPEPGGAGEVQVNLLCTPSQIGSVMLWSALIGAAVASAIWGYTAWRLTRKRPAVLR